MKKIITLLLVAVLAMAAWFFASPYWAVYQLKNAYDSHDIAKITTRIDFPSVQTSVKSQLMPVLVQKMQSLTQSPFAKLLNVQVDENAMVAKLVNQAVDNAITADGVQSALTTQGNVASLNNNVKLLGGLTAVAMGKIKITPETLVDLATAKTSEDLNQKLLSQVEASDVAKGGSNADTTPTAHYCGINCFAVQTQVQGYPLTVQMGRKGFATWQIVGVKLPI